MASSASNRICWILGQLDLGREPYVTISTNPDTGVDKIKIMLAPPRSSNSGNSHRYTFARMVLQQLKVKVAESIAVDKGHCASRGNSIIEFWIKPSPRSAMLNVDQGISDVGSRVIPPVPPVPPPPIAASPVSILSTLPQTQDLFNGVQVQIQGLAEQLLVIKSYVHVTHQLLESQQNLCMNINTNSLMLYPMSEKLEASTRAVTTMSKLDEHINRLDGKITKLIGDVDAGQGTLTAKLGDLALRMSSAQATVSMSPVRMKRYVFHRTATEIGVQTSRVYDLIDKSTQITARAFHEEMSDGDKSGDDDDDENLVSVSEPIMESNKSLEPSVSDSDESEGHYVPVSKSVKQSSRFWKQRVLNSEAGVKGTVYDILRNEDTRELVYAVQYDDGDYDNRIPKDEIILMATAYTESKVSKHRAEKASSSSSRRR